MSLDNPSAFFVEIRSLIAGIELVVIELIALTLLIKHFWHILAQKQSFLKPLCVDLTVWRSLGMEQKDITDSDGKGGNPIKLSSGITIMIQKVHALDYQKVIRYSKRYVKFAATATTTKTRNALGAAMRKWRL